jgi:hypothetical protein
MCPYQVRFQVPEKVEPTGACLHLAKDKGFLQADANHLRRHLRLSRYLC